jgi:hypothetical protein
MLFKTLLMCLFVSSLYASHEDDLSQLSRGQFIKAHHLYTNFLIKMEHATLYPPFKESKYSYLNYFLESAISPSYAAAGSGGACLFAGWVSKKKSNGRCSLPWHSRDYARSLGVNDYGAKCGAEHLMRCNPTLFGPGPNKDETKKLKIKDGSGFGDNHNTGAGICLDIKSSYKGLTARCAQASKDLAKLRGKNWLKEMSEDEFQKFYDEKFKPLQIQVRAFCKNNPNAYNDGTCENLLESLDAIKKEDQLLDAVAEVAQAQKQLEKKVSPAKKDCVTKVDTKEKKVEKSAFQGFLARVVKAITPNRIVGTASDKEGRINRPRLDPVASEVVEESKIGPTKTPARVVEEVKDKPTNNKNNGGAQLKLTSNNPAKATEVTSTSPKTTISAEAVAAGPAPVSTTSEDSKKPVPKPEGRPFDISACWSLGKESSGKGSITTGSAKSLYDALETFAAKAKACGDEIESIKVFASGTSSDPLPMGECPLIKIHPDYKADSSGKIHITFKSNFTGKKVLSWRHDSLRDYKTDDWLNGHRLIEGSQSISLMEQAKVHGICN